MAPLSSEISPFCAQLRRELGTIVQVRAAEVISVSRTSPKVRTPPHLMPSADKIHRLHRYQHHRVNHPPCRSPMHLETTASIESRPPPTTLHGLLSLIPSSLSAARAIEHVPYDSHRHRRHHRHRPLSPRTMPMRATPTHTLDSY